MPTSPDGVLTAVYDPATASVVLTVAGGAWPSPVATVSMTRQVVDGAAEPVRALSEPTPASGGSWLGSDHEMPLDADVTYVVTGRTSAGVVVATVSVTVSTAGSPWGLWIKAAGRAEWTLRVDWIGVSERATATQGGVYQVVGGDAVQQSSGVGAETMTLTVATRTPAQTAALRTVLTRATARTLLLQTGQPEEIVSGWYALTAHAEANPTGLRSDLQALRHFTLQVTRTQAPAGAGRASAGATYRSVRARHGTYAGVLAAGTYADIARGA